MPAQPAVPTLPAVPSPVAIKVLAAIVVPPHLTASGGARAGRRLSEALTSSCDVSIASMSGVDAGQPGAAKCRAVQVCVPAPLRVLPPKYRSLFYASDIAGLVGTERWDLVHLHNPMPALELARIARACTLTRTPYVISTHGFNEVVNGRRIYGFGRLKRLAWRTCVEDPVRRVVRGAAAVFALSPADIDIVRGFGFDGPITVVPNGVDGPEPAGDAADQRVWDRFGVQPPDRFSGITCMFLGNHTPNKGVPVLLEAFSKLGCPFQLIVGGERRAGVDYDASTRQLRPGQRIIVTGRLSDAEVGALLRRSELFVFPTLADTFPLVVLEAMAQGCAVLASDVGGIPYQVQGGCGLLVPPGDVAALRGAVASLSADPAAIAAMRTAAAARVGREFTWQAAAAQAHAGYLRVLERARQPRLSGGPEPFRGPALATESAAASRH